MTRNGLNLRLLTAAGMMIGSVAIVRAQSVATPASTPAASPAIPDVPPISRYTMGVPSSASETLPTLPKRSEPTGLTTHYFFGPYRHPEVPQMFQGNASRLRSLIRDDKLYLSERDAIALAIENNLDVEIQRYNLVLADTDRTRAAGGGNLRGIDFTIEEPPNGVGGPGSPLLTTSATNPNPTAPAVTDLTSLNATQQQQTNLSGSSTATAQYSPGPQVPLFDPSLFLESGYLRRSDTNSLVPSVVGGDTTGGTTGTGTAASTQAQPLNFISADISYLQGFRYGTQLEASVNNDSQVIYGENSQHDPFSQPSTSITLTQPLLRGFGSSVNLRYMRIANENRKISRLLFEQQVIETIYGTSRIYYDLVALGENIAVKQEALRAAERLERDYRDQVGLGTLAPIDLLRATALVSSSQFDLTQAQGLYRTQEVILRNLIMRTGSQAFAIGFSEIVPTDKIAVPAQLDKVPMDKLIQAGLARRPDLAQSQLQIKTGQINASASRNEAKPQLNVFANVETRGSFEQAFEQLGTPGTGLPTLPLNFALGGLRVSTIYQGGIQLNLPLRNRVAEADAARDVVQVRQVQARTEKLAESIRQDIENAQIAVETSFAAYQAALNSRNYQEELLEAERNKLEFGESTNLLVLQQIAYLAQAESTEVAARSNFKKASIELDRDLGNLLDKSGILLDDAIQGVVKP